jgi:hypothetical protein
MNRLNGEGLPREKLLWALTRPDRVAVARKTDSCLLCRAPKVNEAGLCDTCMPLITAEELRLVEKWMSGVGP